MHLKERTTDGHRFTQIRRAFLLATGFWLLLPVGLADEEGEHYSHSMGEKCAKKSFGEEMEQAYALREQRSGQALRTARYARHLLRGLSGAASESAECVR